MIETDKISLAASWIKEKKIIAYPTEGVWGIGCINNQSVISKLSEIKQRPKDKKYILLFRSVDDLRKKFDVKKDYIKQIKDCLLYTSPSPRDRTRSRMPSSA